MDKLQRTYTNESEIPEQYKELYESGLDGFKLKEIEGLPSPSELTKLQRAVSNERQSHDDLKSKIKDYFGDSSFEEINSKLKSLKKTNVEDKNLEVDDLKSKLSEATKNLEDLRIKNIDRDIKDYAYKTAIDSKIVSTAINDVVALAAFRFKPSNDGSYVDSDGQSLDEWFEEAKTKRPHLFGLSSGGGAQGNPKGQIGAGLNPWNPDNFDLDLQTEIYRQDPVRAGVLANKFGFNL